MKKIIFAGAIFLFSGIALVSAVHAEDLAGVKIQPSIIEEKVDPGQTFNSVLRVTNISSAPQVFYLAKKNISDVSSEGFPIFAKEGEEETGFEISSWIKLSDAAVEIPAGQIKEIPFSIIVPNDASPGSHFGGIFLTLKPPKLRETGTGVGYEVGTIVSLKISGDIIEEARLREFFADKSIYGKPDVKFNIKVENLGNALVRPRGFVEITSMFGEKTGVVRINDSGGAVLPKKERGFEALWQGDKFALGRYQAIVSLVYGDEGRKTISSTLSFWILPIKIIFPVLGVLFAVILIIYVSVKLHIRKKLREVYNNTAGQPGFSKNGKIDKGVFGQDGQPISRLAIIAVAVLSLVIIFLLALFILFA